MIEFLTNNWQFVVAIGAGIIELIVMLLFKKRPEVVDNSILSKVCDWILIAEGKFTVGSEKMAFVLEKAKDYLGDTFIEKDIRSLVELILTLPQKKEGK